MNREAMISKLREIHGNDEEQINFILSAEQKILVTASAGCGKTKTMISKIAYELITTPNMNFKKVLALSFSVNAATKIKEDTAKILPQLLDKKGFDLGSKLDVSNYHSFSTKLLYKHGYILHNQLKNIESFSIVPDYVQALNQYLISSEANKLKSFSKAINELNFDEADKLEEDYVDILLNKLIPNKILTYDGLLILANKLLGNDTVSRFYKKYYPLIIVDEFQDTNYLAYKLITSLIDEENKIVLMGDDIQKIYGFLGAIPDLFKHVESEFDMTSMEFKTNYRFSNNEKMKKLDLYIREVFRNYEKMDNFEHEAEINLGFFTTRRRAAKEIVESMIDKISDGYNVALLVRGKKNANNVISYLEEKGLSYFNGLFSDIDQTYNKFHSEALEIFLFESGSGKSISKRVLDRVIDKVEEKKASISSDDIVFNSLVRLLNALFDSVKASTLSREDKYNKIIFVLGNSSLKRLMNEIDEDIVLTTIHGSKGLEWDYVYIPEVMESKFPNYYTLCKNCKEHEFGVQSKYHCKFTFPKSLQARFEEELSLLYVGITRAKQDVYLFANTEEQNGYQQLRSCFTSLPNLSMNREF